MRVALSTRPTGEVTTRRANQNVATKIAAINVYMPQPEVSSKVLSPNWNTGCGTPGRPLSPPVQRDSTECWMKKHSSPIAKVIIEK